VCGACEHDRPIVAVKHQSTAAMERIPQRLVVAGSSPSTSTFQGQVTGMELLLESWSSTPGPDPCWSSILLETGHPNKWKRSLTEFASATIAYADSKIESLLPREARIAFLAMVSAKRPFPALIWNALARWITSPELASWRSTSRLELPSRANRPVSHRRTALLAVSAASYFPCLVPVIRTASR